jgi:hypothetical protein
MIDILKRFFGISQKPAPSIPDKDPSVANTNEKTDQMQNNSRGSKPAQKKAVGKSANKGKASAQKGLSVNPKDGTKRGAKKVGASSNKKNAGKQGPTVSSNKIGGKK